MRDLDAAALTTEGLSRQFGEVTAVDGLDLIVPRGRVIGLVGPNGSGKSTLIRMLLGLVRPTSGTGTVLGQSLGTPERYLARVGALVEGPAFVPALSARQNLLSLARLRGLPVTRVPDVLAMVGLAGRELEPVKRFSLGMKQRLGIAAALLPDPELLILDEPTNGLDPSGILEIRALLRRLGDEGRTVFVSSHLLGEIEAVCDHLVMIRFGKLIYAGSVDGLVQGAQARIEVRPEHDSDTDRLGDALRSAGWSIDGELAVVADADQAAAINRDAARAGLTLRHLIVTRRRLEDAFIEMTGTDAELAGARATTTRRPD